MQRSEQRIMQTYYAMDWATVREGLGLSITDAARLIGVSRQTVYNLEQHRPAKLETITAMLKAYGKHPGDDRGPSARPRTTGPRRMIQKGGD